MKTVTVETFSFDELSDEAKERALEDWNRDDPYSWDREFRDTLKAFEDEFGVKVERWEYSPSGYDFTLRTDGVDSDGLELKGNRARAWFWNNHGAVLLEPRKTWWYRDRDTGKWTRGLVCGTGEPNPVRKSKVFFDRVYDGTCPWTGYCMDCLALDPIAHFCFGVEWDEKEKKRVPSSRRIAVDDSNTVESLLRDCVHSMFRYVRDDWAVQRTMEAFKDACEANDYRFTCDGKMWSGRYEAKEAG